MDELQRKIESVLYGIFKSGQIMNVDLGESTDKCQVQQYLGKGRYKICLFKQANLVTEVDESALYPLDNIFAKDDDEKKVEDVLSVAALEELKVLVNDIKKFIEVQTYVSEMVKKIESDLEATHISDEMTARFKAESEKIDKILKEADLTKAELEGVKVTASSIRPTTNVVDKEAVEKIVHRLSTLVARTSIPQFEKIAKELYSTTDANITFKAKLDKEKIKEIKQRIEKEVPKTEKQTASLINASVLDVLDSWWQDLKNLGAKLLAKFIPAAQKNREEITELHNELKEQISG